MINKAKIVMLALILLDILAGQAFFATLAQICATRADVTLTFTGNSPATNNTDSGPPQSKPNIGSVVLLYPNGTEVVVTNSNGSVTAPEGGGIMISSIASINLEASSGGSVNYVTIDYHYPFWATLENIFELMRDINGEISLTLICIFCLFELKKQFPKWHGQSYFA